MLLAVIWVVRVIDGHRVYLSPPGYYGDYVSSAFPPPIMYSLMKLFRASFAFGRTLKILQVCFAQYSSFYLV